MLSFFLAVSLFATFTSLPPDLPDQHPHILQNDVKQPILPASTSGLYSSNNDTKATLGHSKEELISYGAIDLPALGLSPNATSVVLNQVPVDHPMQQNPILSVLRKAQVSELSVEDWKQLPELARNLADLYGSRILDSSNNGEESGPVVIGMETCQSYRDAVPKNERYVGPGGMFNTGTNAMEHHLTKNLLHMPAVWQIPWGKHRMEWRRLNHVAPGMEKKDQTKCMPVVVVRDPYNWMQSMCKSPYAAHWKHAKNRCPNLVASEEDRKRFKDVGHGDTNSSTFRVKVLFDKDNDVETFESLAELWTIWYGRYLNATYPRLIVRFEDMLLQAPAVLAKVAECVDAQVRDPILYQQESAKAHGSHTDFLKAILKTADRQKRSQGFTSADLEYSMQKLDSTLMKAFQYQWIEPS